MSTRQPSRVVFVGNIPYGLTEEQITEIFSGAGRVLNFRLVYDRETGRPKGFGFAEFPDYDSAASAVRNLNDYEIMGRKLRVDFSNETVSDDDNRGDRDGPLLDILQQMKTLATNDPARCTELLTQAPQLSYAVFQALLIMGLVSPDAINSVLEPGAALAAAGGGGIPPPASAPVGGYGTPPVAAGGYAPPPPQPTLAAMPAPAGGQDPEALMRAVLELPQETIDQLPEAERQQIMALRASYAAQVRR
ncbi:hypothetical protein N0V88_004041 [Collariella sp. IMI 366227]|nr:hypothetical protein N0V88_004041 [Collariella sp. IMI 366227]